jgi:hypothetical protein
VRILVRIFCTRPVPAPLRLWRHWGATGHLDGDLLGAGRPTIPGSGASADAKERKALLLALDQEPERTPLIERLLGALAHSLVVVSRHGADFESTGVKLFNPWLQPAPAPPRIGRLQLREGLGGEVQASPE